MMIADADQVRAAYPTVADDAITTLLAALYRAADLIDAGQLAAAEQRTRRDLASYGGPIAELERLHIGAIMEALRHSADRTAYVLGHLGLLAADTRGGPTGDRVRYAMVGDPLGGRLWARERGIAQNLVISIVDSSDSQWLHGLDAAHLIIVRFRPVHPRVEEHLQALIACGATVRDRSWRRPARDQPPLDLRGALR